MSRESPRVQRSAFKVTEFQDFADITTEGRDFTVVWRDRDDRRHSIPLQEFSDPTSAHARILALCLLADDAVSGASRAAIAQADADISVQSYEKALEQLPRLTSAAIAKEFSDDPTVLDHGASLSLEEKLAMAAAIVHAAAGAGQRSIGELTKESIAKLMHGRGWKSVFPYAVDQIFPTKASACAQYHPRDRVPHTDMAAQNSEKDKLRAIFQELLQESQMGAGMPHSAADPDSRQHKREGAAIADSSGAKERPLTAAAVEKWVNAARKRDRDSLDEDDESNTRDKRPAYTDVAESSKRLGVIEMSGFAGAEARNVLRDLDDSFSSHNGDELFDVIQKHCKSEKHAASVLLIADIPGIEAIMDGKEYHRRTFRHSRADVRLRRRQDLAVLLNIGTQAPPSSKPQGRARLIDINHYGSSGVDQYVCVSTVYPDTPTSPFISLWGRGDAERPGTTVHMHVEQL